VADEPTSRQPFMIGRDAVGEDGALEANRARLLELIDDIPPSADKRRDNALMCARELIARASFRAADISKMLALQPESTECSTLLADLAAIWRVQAQLVAEIGRVFGKSGQLTEKSIISCLFRHAAAQFAREVVTGLGERLLVQCGSQRARPDAGTEIVPRVARQRSSRLLPIIGAVIVAAYAYYDTDRIGQEAIEFFTKEIELT
jgi:uncharacterized protein (DUF697 family)